MTAAFDTLGAARDLETAGMDRAHAEAVASAIRAGQSDLATRADLTVVRADIAGVKSDIATLRWIIGVHMAISLATLAAVLAMAFRG